MSASLPIPFAIGETVWNARAGMVERHRTCPECLGTCALTLIKGNGEEVTLPCGHCQSGCNPPRGHVTEYVFRTEPVEFTCSRVVSMNGGVVTYTDAPPDATCYTMTDSSDLFRSREEAVARLAVLAAEHEEELKRREIAAIASSRHSLAFSASYWSQKVASIRKELATAEARLKACKAPRADVAR